MSKFYLVLYNTLIIFALPFIAVVVLINKKYRKELFYKISERFACYSHLNKLNKDLKKKTVWIHCASLGEVRAVEPILDSLRNDYFIVLTSLTKSGREYAVKLQKADFVVLLPLDIYPITNRAFNIIRPDLLVLVETELWASMLYTADKCNVEIITINGRISEKSFRIYKNLRFFWNKFAGLINIIIARSVEDADRFKYLTGEKNVILVSGNIKYDRVFTSTAKREEFSLKESDFIFTAGSTRENEEIIIANAYIKVGKKIKVFLAPRHLARIPEVMRILDSKCIKYSLFSENDFGGDFILIDVFGKLQNIYSISDVCYVGGSLVDKGGQNPIEPAAYGKAVLFGEHMDNFKTEAESLVENGGAFIVKNVNDLAEKIKGFMANKKFLEYTGSNALKTVYEQKGALSFTIGKIKEILNAR
jgi:3-deoxy-D-manno-octulosonic-acid transferase